MRNFSGIVRWIYLVPILWLVCGMAPANAESALQFSVDETAGRHQQYDDAVLDEQTLAQKPEVYLQLIAGMQQRGLYYASLAHLDAFDARWPRRADAALLRANALRETEQTEAARALYQNLLNGRLAAQAQHGLGLIAMKAGDLEEGSAALNRAAALAPVDVAILGDQGYAYLMLGKYQEARVALFKAAELDAANKRIGANLVLLMELTGQFGQAQELMQRYDLSPRVRDEILARAAEIKIGQKTTKEVRQ